MQPLLLRNTIVVPYEFTEGKVFRELSWAISWIKTHFDEDEERKIILRVNGIGGDVADMFASVDLIRAEARDTEIVGYLYGEAASAHSALWAACPKRYVMPHGILCVHSVSAWFSQRVGHNEMASELETIRVSNERMAKIYGAASSNPAYGPDYWMHKLDEYPRFTFNLDADQLVDDYQMCELFDPEKE